MLAAEPVEQQVEVRVTDERLDYRGLGSVGACYSGLPRTEFQLLQRDLDAGLQGEAGLLARFLRHGWQYSTGIPRAVALAVSSMGVDEFDHMLDVDDAKKAADVVRPHLTV